MGRLAEVARVLIAAAASAGADQPLAAPANYRIYSLNRGCYAFLDAGRKTTTVYRVRRGAPPSPMWDMPGWFRVAALSDDCEHFVIGFDGNNLLPLDTRGDQVMLSFFHRGKLLRTVQLRQLVGDLSKLRRTVSHYYWGHYVGFDRQNRFLLETVEGRRLAFDVITGNEAASEARQ